MVIRKLRPASETASYDYDIKPIEAPRLSGWLLRLAVWILESVLGAVILTRMWRRSGIQQVLRETEVPEEATYQPAWPHPDATSAGVDIEVLDVPRRATVAAHTIPGFAAIREFTDSGVRNRRWEVADYVQAYNMHLVTPLDVAHSILERLEESEAAQPPMRFLVSQNAEDLLNQAEEATSRYRHGQPISPLDGVPYVVIDAIDALPYPTSAGTGYLAGERPVTADAPCIAALRQAGAMLVGKATLHELGIGMTGVSPRSGTARNPYDTGRCAGGSSSGSAAAVSAGLCAFALGIDGGGSVRVPAALCGLVALKPTTGRTSHLGCPENAFSIMSIGPIAATVGDAMLINAVISNAGTQDKLRQPAPTTLVRSLFDDTPGAQPNREPLKGRRAGVFWPWFEDAHPEVVGAAKAALKTMEQLGCELVDVAIPELEMVKVAQMVSIGCEIAQACKAAYSNPRKRRQMNLETRFTLASTTRFLATDFIQAQKIRTRLLTHFRRIFAEVDLLVSPTVSITAPPISEVAAKSGESDMRLTGNLMRFTIPVNMSGIPAITLPVGQDSSGLPIGMQLMGKPWREADLLFVASALESTVRSQAKLPAVSYDVLFGKTL